MKAFEIVKGSTSLDGLRMTEREQPEPVRGQVLIRVYAASVNYRDLAIVSGRYIGGSVQRDTIALSDGAGEVVAVGADVDRFKVGDRVAGTFFQGWVEGVPSASVAALGSPLDGMLAEYVALDQEGLVPVPVHLSFEQAATLPCAAVTAWNALMVNGRIKPGDSVLALGTGGVSIFALQFARMSGARVIITSSSDEKLERAMAMGADAGINYRNTPDWEQEVLSLTGGAGVDHVVEVGGAGTLAKSFQAVGYGGQVTLIGVLSGREGDTNPHPLMPKAARLQGVFVGSREMFENMNRAISINQMIPVVDKVFPFDDAPRAYKFQMAGRHFGKIVISID
ncbi:MAG: NAD(P)-dependent alcohol dehydrogenase [Xanthomonadales bacterium]